MLSKKLMLILILTVLLGGTLLSACAGGATIDVNVDPETGQGTIDIIGSGEDGNDGQQTSGGLGTDNAIMIAIIVALLLAVIALVVALVGRRPSA
ncbi:MAG TPA: hypothetical protein PLC52_08620 [Anaerolineales bacterium]|nr:hypothetical protein [Anaerolineales bacterium]HRQ92912.1 hypothetical protein [Anaerolineales bacterium]